MLNTLLIPNSDLGDMYTPEAPEIIFLNKRNEAEENEYAFVYTYVKDQRNRELGNFILHDGKTCRL